MLGGGGSDKEKAAARMRRNWGRQICQEKLRIYCFVLFKVIYPLSPPQENLSKGLHYFSRKKKETHVETVSSEKSSPPLALKNTFSWATLELGPLALIHCL